MKVYSAYRPSGAEWLGAVPAHWRMAPIRSLFAERKCRNKGLREQNLLSLSYGQIVKKDIHESKGLTPGNYEGYNVVEPDDIVLRLTDLQNDRKSLRTGLVTQRGIITSAYLTLTPIAEVSSAFVHYQLHIFDVRKCIYGMGNGVRQTLNFSMLSKLPLALPSLPEQNRIVAYLDGKCAHIAELLTRREKIVEYLQELKQSIIANAVTKGLDPDTPTKDSGVPWLGQVPTHWQVMPSRFLFRESKEIRKPGDEKLAATQQFGVIPQTEYMERMKSRIVTATQDLDKWKHVEAGNFVISLRSFQGGLELCKMAGCVTWHYIVLSGKLPQINLSYFKWLFKSRPYILQLQSTCNFIRDGQDLRYSNFKKVPLPLMGVEEQAEIAAYLDTKCAAIDELVARHRAMIERLKELKTSLIAAAVTGKIDVR